MYMLYFIASINLLTYLLTTYLLTATGDETEVRFRALEPTVNRGSKNRKRTTALRTDSEPLFQALTLSYRLMLTSIPSHTVPKLSMGTTPSSDCERHGQFPFSQTNYGYRTLCYGS